MKIVSIVPIKLNNERLPGKNTLLLGGKPLISYVQEMLLQVDEIEERYVFCSDASIEEYLVDGIVYIKRDKVLDSSNANFTQIFGAFLETVDADIYVYAHATAPFITAETTRKCIEAVASGEYDSAFTATKIQDFLWSNGKPLNFDATNVPRSQDIEPIYRESSGVYVFTKEVFKTLKRRVGLRPYVSEITYKEAIDINGPEDFDLAQKFI